MKKLKIQFWRAKLALAMQILEQEGLPKRKDDGLVNIAVSPALSRMRGIWLRGYQSSLDFYVETVDFESNHKRDKYLQDIVNAITDELFTGEGELRIEPTVEECGQLVTYTWEEK